MITLPLIFNKIRYGVMYALKKVFEKIACIVEIIADSIDLSGKAAAKQLRARGELVFWENHESCYDDFYA